MMGMRVDHVEVELTGDQEDDRADGRHALEAAGAALGGLKEAIECLQEAHARHGWHTQKGPEARAVCGTRKGKRPTENGWALNSGGLGQNRTADTRIFNPLLYRLS